jgi:SOS-response transcriptional repressor LexA
MLRGERSRVEFAREIGIAEATLRRYEQGGSRIPTDFIEQVCRAMGISADWLLFGVEVASNQVIQSGCTTDSSVGSDLRRYAIIDGERVRIVCVPVLTRVPAGGALEMEDPMPVGSGLEGWMWVADPIDENAYGLIAAGDSMEPLIPNGESFLVSPRRRFNFVNGIAVIRLRGGEVCVKNVVIRSDNVEVRSANPRYQTRRFPASEVEILGEVRVAVDMCTEFCSTLPVPNGN